MTFPAPLSRRDFGRLAAAAAGLTLIDPRSAAARTTPGDLEGSPALQSVDAPPLEYEPLMDIVLDVGQPQVIGSRRIVPVTGGTFEGPRLRGRALEGGADWMEARPDGANELNVRVTLETDDDALIYATYRGILHNPPDGELYWRVTPYFETAADQYDWLNRIVTVGVGRQQPGQAAYWFYRIL